MKQLILLLLIAIPSTCWSQFTDDFADGDLSNNPSWQGNPNEFKVNNQNQLQLDGTGSESYLVTSSQEIKSTEWRFWFKLDFEPSNSNQLKVYLVSDQQDLTGPVNGYYIGTGETGSTDGVDLYRQDGNSSTKIIDGFPGHVGKNTNTLRVKVTRDDQGKWEVYSDTLGGTNFLLEGDTTDQTYTSTNYFGLLCEYTTTRSDKFFFDDFYAGPIQVDSFPPKLEASKAIDKDTVLASFNETIDPASAEDAQNYIINKGIGNPTQAFLNPSNNQEVYLVLENSLSNKTQYTLTASKIQDPKGNELSQDSASFTFFQAEAGDVIVNEIFPDPNPTQGLPEAEFVELYNQTQFEIDLENWEFGDERGLDPLPQGTLKPDSYLIICSGSNEQSYQAFGPTLGTSNFPVLNNGGDDVVIANPKGKIIDEITYDVTWYKDEEKSNGGWTIERINPDHPCSGPDNWIASTNNQGGTPGQKNSVFSSQPDTTTPFIEKVEIIDSLTLKATLSEEVDTSSILNLDYEFKPIIQVKSIIPKNEAKGFELVFQNPLKANTSYSFQYQGLSDCWGNELDKFKSIGFDYVVPQPASPFDVIINELMVKPEPTIALPPFEYVELKNVADHPIALGNWTIADLNSQSQLPDVIIKPNENVIVCRSGVSSNFEPFGKLAAVGSLPSLNNSGDRITLRDDAGTIISVVQYKDDWYEDEIKAEGGWSLERIDPKNPCGGNNNWQASDDKSGGTPGAQNSIQASNPDVAPPKLENVTVKDSVTLKAFFNEPMDSASIDSNANYTINNYEGNVISANPIAPLYQSVEISLSAPLEVSILYKLEINRVTDCSGNEIGKPNQGDFGLPEPADSLDVVVNEILFNPPSGGADYVEFYNQSDKVINIANSWVASINDTGALENLKNISETGYLLLPQDYLVITESKSYVNNNYGPRYPDKIIEVGSLPTFPNESGNVVLVDQNSNIIDHVNYSESWHFELIDNFKGVALERIDPEDPSNDPDNWHSAASSTGYKTPTYENSQADKPKKDASTIALKPDVFSPNQDGYKDLLYIQYQFDESGKTAQVKIFDSRGRQVRKLVNNALLGKSGSFTWDGTRDNGEKASMGVYIILIEITDLDGTTKTYKRSTTLGGDF